MLRCDPNGKPSLLEGMGEVKGFFGTAEEAATFAKGAYSTSMSAGGPFTITTAEFPTSLLPEGIPVAGEGTAYFLPGSTLPSAGPITIMQSAPIP